MPINPSAAKFVSLETSISPVQTLNVLTMLLDEACTIPFISRYRKEKTGGLDEVQIGLIEEKYNEYIEREKRREYILDTIKKMEQLTPKLEQEILAATTINQLEDLYAPFKSKKKTKGVLATEAGLLPLAELMMSSKLSLDQIKSKHEKDFINAEKKIHTFEDALTGAQDIIIETFAHDVEIKEQLRKDYWQSATLTSKKKDKIEDIKDYHKYQDYFDYSEPVKDLKDEKAGHRFLAMRRGMSEKILKVDVSYDSDAAIGLIKKKYISPDLGAIEKLMDSARRAYNNYIHPSLDLEIKSELKKLADESAINVFGINLKNLLLQPYLGAKTVMGVDPGIRTGCKIVVVDNTGKFIVDFVIYPHPPKNEVARSAQIISAVLEQFKVEYIAIGNGTYGRETLQFFTKNVPNVGNGKIKATLISEAGASIYSASEIARKEFPDKDPTVRGAISIARRFQDPLAELVKIDPKSIGVGQYQHDVNQARLKKSLTSVVENCVNYVGVDINTASAPLLSYISGIGATLATNLVKYREEKGGIKKRSELLNVPRFSDKIFEQSAGFLRIYNSDYPLDSTFIHPERYLTIEAWAKREKIPLNELPRNNQAIDKLAKDATLKEEVGEFTLKDIVTSLKAPSQDPRTEFKSIDFRQDISQITDLKIDEWYTGVVTNITQFGAFVDIGIKENGLLHVSQISDTFTSNALDALKVGQELKVKVVSIDMERRRISLSCKKGKEQNFSQDYSQPTRTKNKQQAPIPKSNSPFAALKNLKLK